MKITRRSELDRAYTFACGLLHKGPVDWACEPWKATRSNEQNALLFGVVYPPIAEAMGYEVDGDNGIHAFFCGTHFGWVDVAVPKTPRNPEGIASEPRRSTTREGWNSGKRNVISKEEFGKFLDTVERIAAKAGVFVPLERAA
jgi:hypothetical protein